MNPTIQSVPPSAALRPYVLAFAQRNLVGASEEQRMPAYLETVLQFDFGDLMTVQSSSGWDIARPRSVVGPHTLGGINLRFEGNVDSFAIFLRPGALWSLFRIPVSVVMETHYDSDDVLGPVAAELWSTLADARVFHRRVMAAETFLAAYVHRNIPETATGRAVALLADRRGRTTIPHLASRVQLSVRQLERCFIREMGITPKRFARVARFQAALDARVVHPDRSWLDIASSAGFFDQMHLIHEFRSLGGLAPTVTLERLGDSRPSALAAAHDDDVDPADAYEAHPTSER